MTTKSKQIVVLCIVLVILTLAVAGILIFANIDWGFSRSVPDKEKALRLHVIETANSWIGSNMQDDTHKAIIDIYNDHTPLAQGYVVQYSDKWCAAFVSTVAIQCELTELIPTECGCQRQIGLFEDMGRWEENDEYVPLPGDIIYYSTEGSDSDENTGWSDHVGIVCGTFGSCIKVIEGNVAGAVAVRYIFVGDASICGYGLPDYASASE